MLKISEWKIWEKMRRDIERKPEDYEDYQVVCKYYFAFLMGLSFAIFGVISFLLSAIMIFQQNTYTAIGFFMFFLFGLGYSIVYATIMDEHKKHPKYGKRLCK